jgi:hypothetical protein
MTSTSLSLPLSTHRLIEGGRQTTLVGAYAISGTLTLTGGIACVIGYTCSKSHYGGFAGQTRAPPLE